MGDIEGPVNLLMNIWDLNKYWRIDNFIDKYSTINKIDNKTV